MKICLIDDNPKITRMFTKLLEINGHKCMIANDGRTGLAMLENEKFDATVLDYSMQGFSGMDVVKSLNKTGRIKEQNVVILTASSASDEELNEMKELGVKECLKKPIELDSLIGILESVNHQSK